MPAETSTLTGAPALSPVPGAGSTPKTVPGLASLKRRTILGTSPALLSLAP